jgi:hypothetical protein
MAVNTTSAEAESEPERAARLAWESRQLDEAREDLRAGRVIADEDVDDLLDRFVRGEPLHDLEDLQAAIKAGLDSGPDLPADQVFAELRARYAAQT